jgi:predicted phosphodiesterase
MAAPIAPAPYPLRLTPQTPPMRFALVSDIHGNLAALEAVIADLEHRQIDQVVNLGDTLSGPLLPAETARRLRALPWLHVAGNHERQVLRLPLESQSASDAFTSGQLYQTDKLWLGSHVDSCDADLHCGQQWPDQLGQDVALCHGSPRSDVEYLLETPVNEALQLSSPDEILDRLDGRIPKHVTLLACGHSHVARAVRLGSGLLIVNPGSVGLPAYDDDHSHPRSRYHRVENGSPEARYAVINKTRHGWVCELISVPYDHESMAVLADQRGRPDWAYALRTGRMPRTPYTGETARRL